MANEPQAPTLHVQGEAQDKIAVLPSGPVPEQYTCWFDELRKCTSAIDAMQQQLTRIHAEKEQLRQLRASAEIELNTMRRVVAVLSQLNLARTLQDAITVVHDLLTNLVGTEQFACVIFGEPAHSTLFSMGVSEARVHAVTAQGGSAFERMMRQGKCVVRKPSQTELAEFLVAVPLCAGEAVVGAVIVFGLLPQKNGLESRDFVFLDLLSKHAAAAFTTRPPSLGKGEGQ